MKKSNFLIATALLVSPLAMAASSQDGTGETDGYKLVWQDLFDANELNSQRWNIEVNGDGGGNNELQYYTDRAENVRLGDDGKGNGCLILTAKKEVYGGRQATSGRITSKNKIAFKHGKIEAAIKLPKTANGLWPAFWMMGNDISTVSWPRCGETDILEMGHSNGIKDGVTDRLFNGALHWGVASSEHRILTGDHVSDYSLQDGEYHIFRVVWTPNEIAMFFDDNKEPYMRVDISDRSSEDGVGYYFHKDNFLLLNMAVGGNFPGIHNAEGITALPQGSAEMLVDYVRIYQKDDAKSTLTLLK